MQAPLRFYRMLLRLYPASFRAEYRHELTSAFAHRVRTFSGPARSFRAFVAAIGDVTRGAGERGNRPGHDPLQ